MKTTYKIIEEAESYTKMVTQSIRKKKFDNKFLLSLCTIAFEKYMVAYLIAKDNLPNGHTLSFLIKEMSRYTLIDKSIVDLLSTLDEKIQLCSIENIEPYIPTNAEMKIILLALQQIQNIVKEEISYSGIA
jgi:HEPN domain-containing protein